MAVLVEGEPFDWSDFVRPCKQTATRTQSAGGSVSTPDIRHGKRRIICGQFCVILLHALPSTCVQLRRTAFRARRAQSERRRMLDCPDY